MSSTASEAPGLTQPAPSTPAAFTKLQQERTALLNHLQELADQESHLNPRLKRIAFERDVLERRVALLDQQIAYHLHPLP